MFLWAYPNHYVVSIEDREELEVTLGRNLRESAAIRSLYLNF